MKNIIWATKNEFVEVGIAGDNQYARRKNAPYSIHFSEKNTQEWKCKKCGNRTSGVEIMPNPFYREGSCSAGWVTSLPFCETCEPEFMAKLSEEYTFDGFTWIKKQ